VKVSGELTYNEIDYHPEAIKADILEVYPEERLFPNMTQLRGIAPEATGDKSPEDFIRELRDEEE
jgi:hypothetical protein